MSHGKLKRYAMWTERKNPVPPEISRILSKLILELALVEDVTGPRASEVKRDQYIAKLAPRLRDSVARELHQAGITVSEEELVRFCRVSASETFVIRTLCEARLEGEVKVQDFSHLPLYRTYQDYFEQSPDIVAKAFAIAINGATSNWATRRDTDKN